MSRSASRLLRGIGLALALLAGSAAADDLSFAPLMAVHDDRVMYRLPHPLDVPRYVSQAVGDKPTHDQPDTFHAFDFAMLEGSPVLAAREGVVGRVNDGQPNDTTISNDVWLLHADGTFALYAHLQAGIEVKEGQKVQRGQLLARSGRSGTREARTGPGDAVPHLHFAVLRRTPGGAHTVPIRFEGPGGRPFVPKAVSWHGQPPRPTVGLRLLSANGPLEAKHHVPLRPGQSLPLRVELVDATGGARDVTDDPKTRFFSMTLFNLDVSREGVVTARPSPGFRDSPNSAMRNASLFVIHGAEGDAEVGHTTLFFWIDPSGRLPGRGEPGS